MLRQSGKIDGAITDFIIEAANNSIKQQVGFAIDHTSEQLLGDVFPNYKKHHFFDVYVTALQTGQLQRKELYYKDDRVEGWFDLGAAPHDDAVIVTFVNITESKNHQQTIEKSAAQLHAIMDIAQSGMFMFAAEKDGQGNVFDFRFTIANRALASYVGQTPEILLGELGSKWFPGYKTNGLFELYKNTYETGKTNRFDFHYNDDEINVWLDIMSTKLGDEVLVTFTDFTPTKTLQLQLEELVNNLKRSNENLEEFAYAASHDLQEPLRKIRFFADRLKSRFAPELGTEGADMLNRMEASTMRMRTLIDDLLSYSRVSCDNSSFESVDTKQIAQEAVTDLETSIQEKSATINIEGLPLVTGDKSQLRQLFQNLFSNSLKYAQQNTAAGNFSNNKTGERQRSAFSAAGAGRQPEFLFN